jgi:hypothetical protein
MTARNKGFAGLAATMLIGTAVVGPSSFAAPSPPTNGGQRRGAGSGQCTGAAGDRPTSCQSPGGVSKR